jgi:hypothetical protein
MESIEQGREIFLDQVNVTTFNSASVFQEEPKTFDERPGTMKI